MSLKDKYRFFFKSNLSHQDTLLSVIELRAKEIAYIEDRKKLGLHVSQNFNSGPITLYYSFKHPKYYCLTHNNKNYQLELLKNPQIDLMNDDEILNNGLNIPLTIDDVDYKSVLKLEDRVEQASIDVCFSIYIKENKIDYGTKTLDDILTDFKKFLFGSKEGNKLWTATVQIIHQKIQ